MKNIAIDDSPEEYMQNVDVLVIDGLCILTETLSSVNETVAPIKFTNF
jgi:hypothetical protein